MNEHIYSIYILTNKKNGTLYIGSTNDLYKRVTEHKEKILKGFSEKYNLDKLVYFEAIGELDAARKKELQMKSWRRDWKVKLIEKVNPDWKDLFPELLM